MIYRYKPKYKSLSYVSAFSEKAYYYVMKQYSIKRRDLALLLLCYQYQQETNSFVTGKGLRPYAPYVANVIYIRLNHLNSVGYVERVKPMIEKGKFQNRVYYNVTKKGLNVINHFQMLIGQYIKDFEENTPTFKNHSDKLFNYYENLGIVNAKKKKSNTANGGGGSATAEEQ